MTRELPTFAGRQWRPVSAVLVASMPTMLPMKLADIFETDLPEDPDRVIVGVWPRTLPGDQSPWALVNITRDPSKGDASAQIALRAEDDGPCPLYQIEGGGLYQMEIRQ